MIFATRQHLLLLIVLAGLSCLTREARGEEDKDGGNSVPQFTPPEAIDQGSPGKMGIDRQKSSAMAKAMAVAAAGQQQIACNMMMQEAMKMESGSDKTMMMMMAMQACAQAAETMKAAAKNEEGENKAKENEPAKGPTMKTPQFKTAGKPKEEKLMKGLESANPTPSDEPVSPEVVVSPTPGIPSFETPAPTPSATPEPTEVAMAEVFVPVTSVPNRIERAKIGYDESGKSGTGPTPDRALGGGSSVATKAGGADASKGGDGNASQFVPNRFRSSRGAGGSDEGGGGGSGGGGSSGSSSDSEGGSSPLDAIMSLLGGGPPPEEKFSPGSDVLTHSDKVDSAKGPNIFEYANFRYRKAAFDENRIKTRGKKEAAIVAQALTKK